MVSSDSHSALIHCILGRQKEVLVRYFELEKLMARLAPLSEKLPVVVLLAGFLVCASGDAVGNEVFPPGHEAAVVQLLEPYDDENLVLAGRPLESLEVGPACEIRLGFHAVAGDDAVTVKLLPAHKTAGSFRFQWDPARPEGLGDALEALVRGNIPEDFFQDRCVFVSDIGSSSGGESEGEGYSFKLFARYLSARSVALLEAAVAFTSEFLARHLSARSMLLLEAILALALFLLVVARRRVDRSEWRTVLGGLLLTGLAFWLRIYLVEPATFHENRHEYRYIQEIIAGSPGYIYPCTYFIVMNFLTLIGGATDQAIFFFNALFSALSVPLLGILVCFLTRSRRAGWAAAAMWALAPHAIRMASTATYFNMVSFFFLAAATATISALRRWGTESRRYHELALAVLLIALSAQSRVLSLAYPAAVVALAYGAGAVRTKQQVLALVRACAAVGILLIPSLISLARLYLNGGSGFLSLNCALRSMPCLMLFDRDVLSPTIFPLALLGLVLILRGGRPLGRVLTAGIILIAAFPAIIYVSLLLSTRRLDGYLYRDAIIEGSSVELLVGSAGVLLIGSFVAFVALWRSVPAMGHHDRRQTAATLFGLLLPLGLTSFVCAHYVGKIRFDLLPDALFTGLAGAGVAGLAGWVGKRSRIAGAAVMILLVGTTLLSYDLLIRRFRDTTEYSFLQREVIPELNRSLESSPVTLVVPVENEGTGQISPCWWRRHVPGLDVRASIREVEKAYGPTAVFAFVGPNCSADHGCFDSEGRYIDEWGGVHSEPPRYKPADMLEGRPRLHPGCADALSGRYWRKVATQEISREEADGSPGRFNESADHIVIGFYRAEALVIVSPMRR